MLNTQAFFQNFIYNQFLSPFQQPYSVCIIISTLQLKQMGHREAPAISCIHWGKESNRCRFPCGEHLAGWQRQPHSSKSGTCPAFVFLTRGHMDERKVQTQVLIILTHILKMRTTFPHPNPNSLSL